MCLNKFGNFVVYCFIVKYLFFNVCVIYVYNFRSLNINKLNFFVLVFISVVMVGFYCFINEVVCNLFCKSRGCKRGYCDFVVLWLRCMCFGCSG